MRFTQPTLIKFLVAIIAAQPFASYWIQSVLSPEVTFTTLESYVYPLLLALFIGLVTAAALIPLLVKNDITTTRQFFRDKTFADRFVIGVLGFYILMFIWGLAGMLGALLP